MNAPQRTDEALLAAFHRDGDVAAFQVLVERYRTPVYNFLLRSLRDPQKAEDLLQDVFVRVIERAEKFRHEAKFSTWLYTIARNKCVDHFRRQKHRRHPSLDGPTRGGDEGARALKESVADTTVLDSERGAGSALLKARIATAVERLPAEQQEVFLMRQLQGMRFQDIADVVGVPLNTVKSRMRYALERLQADLVDYEEEAQQLR